MPQFPQMDEGGGMQQRGWLHPPSSGQGQCNPNQARSKLKSMGFNKSCEVASSGVGNGQV